MAMARTRAKLNMMAVLPVGGNLHTDNFRMDNSASGGADVPPGR
ncbi:MAG TPA: hypothetical protein VKZ74_03880 [Natronosporangium sp.]|nr:hypothetical protein [Natronosporangium sp.]